MCHAFVMNVVMYLRKMFFCGPAIVVSEYLLSEKITSPVNVAFINICLKKKSIDIVSDKWNTFSNIYYMYFYLHLNR